MIAYLRAENGGDRVRNVLVDSSNQTYAHALNLCEVYYDFYRSDGPETALQAIRDLEFDGVIPQNEMSASFWQSAGSLKAVRKRISLADCFGLALADRLGGTLLTADHHEFDVLAWSGHSIRFIR